MIRSDRSAMLGLRVAVTGASGFCGAEVARRAEQAGADVICLGRRPGPVGRHIYWDAATDRPDLAGADVVLHLAAAVGDEGRDPAAAASFRAVNVDGAARLLDAARSRPLVWVSSASVYDPTIDRRLIPEDHPIGNHLSAYGRTKALGEWRALEHGSVVLRPRAVYGPGDRHLLPRLRASARAGVAILPGRDVWLSLTAVENLADACLAAPGWPPGAYNVADASAYRRDDVVRQVLAACGTPVRIAHVPLRLATAVAGIGQWRRVTRYAIDQVGHDVVLDLRKIMAQGWAPRRTLSEFLAELRFSPDGAGGGARRGRVRREPRPGRARP